MSAGSLTEVDPYSITISEENERRTDIGIEDPDFGSFSNNVQSVGVLNPPHVRKISHRDYDYEAITGQRRIIAAQSAELDRIPVLIVNWDDTEALLASITENVDFFRKSVNGKDRARAVKRIMDKEGWDAVEVAKELGVSPGTIRRWLEYGRDEWEGTAVHINTPENPFEDAPPGMVTSVRRITGGGDDGEELLSRLLDLDFNRDDARELRRRVSNGGDLESEIEDIRLQKVLDSTKKNRLVEFKLAGEDAHAIEAFAEDQSKSVSKAARDVLLKSLKEKGFL